MLSLPLARPALPSTRPISSTCARPDIDHFLRSYPRFKPDPTKTANLDFYKGKGRASPDDATIDELLDRLENDWDEVESNHGFIQWLFPIPEHGMNSRSQPLEPHEAKQMSSDPVVIDRLLRSYELMLSFYGIRMADRNLACLERADDWKSRFQHLLRHPHNLLRITRILNCLTVLSPRASSSSSSGPSPTFHHPTSLVLFFLAQHNEGRLNLSPGTTAGGSLDRFWSGCVFDAEEREWVARLVQGRKGAASKGKHVDWGEDEYKTWVATRFDQKEAKNGEKQQLQDEAEGGDHQL